MAAEAGRAGASTDVETDHEYDGIREFDNPLPRWWLLTLYGTVVFSVGYWFFYHTLGAGLLPMAAYREEIAAAEARAGKASMSDDEVRELAKDEAAVGRGAALFQQNCVVCHGDRGQGVVGPNLTDGHFLHGPRPSDSYQVISRGVLDKGMPAWGAVLGPSKVRDLTAFVTTLRGKMVPGRPPQGDPEGSAKAAR